MKGAAEIIEYLNKSLEGELYAIMQYILHSETMEHLGYDKLAAHIKQEAMQEMVHAEKLTERILFLEGTPKMLMNREIKWEQDFRKNLESQLNAEMEGIAIYKEGVKRSREVEDAGTRQLFQSIIKEEEDHVDWIESQFNLIEKVGLENYLAQHMHGDE
ncbi:MAG: bacterioferritin [Calditrichia bacterium]